MTAPAHPQRCNKNNREEMSDANSRQYNIDVVKEKCFEWIVTENDFIEFQNDVFTISTDYSDSRNLVLLTGAIQKFMSAIRSRPHSSVQSRDQVLDDVIKVIHKKVSLPTNSGKQISCDASIRLGIIYDINKELRTQGSRNP